MADFADFISTVVEDPAANTTTDTDTSSDTQTEPEDHVQTEQDTTDSDDDAITDENVEDDEAGADKKSNAPDPVKQIKAAIEAIKKSGDAKTAKLLHDSYFRFESMKNELGVKDVDEARILKATLDGAGGLDGITALQNKAATLEATDANFDKGDPSVVEDMSEAYPDGFKKIVPLALDKLKAMDKDAFYNTIRPATLEHLETAGFLDAIGTIQQALKDADGETILKTINSMTAWFKGQKALVGDGTKPKVDPEREKFERERTEFQQTKERDYRNSIGQQATARYNKLIDTTMAPYLKQYKLGAEAKEDALNGIYAEVTRLNKANKNYNEYLKSAFGAKDRDAAKIRAYVEANLDQVVPKAVNTIMARRYKGVTPAKVTTTTSTTKPQNGKDAPQKMGGSVMPVKIAKEPSHGEIDWSKDKNQILYITSQAYLKSGPNKGKLVTWK